MRQRQQLRRLFHSYWTAGILLVFLVFLSLAFMRGARGWWRERERYQELDNKLQELRAEKTRLEREITYFNNPANVAEEAKKTLGLVEPGEELVIVVPKEATRSEEKPKEPGWWSKFWDWLR